EIRRFERVLGWARSKFPEITGFWTKARKLIAYSLIGDKDDEKSLQSVTGLVPECELPLDRQDILTIEFSDSDKDIIQIIRCFISYHGSGYRQVDNPYQVVVPLILKPLRVYGDIDVDAATQFLVDIGAWPKWQNLNLYDIRVPIEGMEVNPAVDQDAMDCQRLAEQFLRDRDNMAAAATAAAASPLIQDRTNVATSLGPDDFMPYDDVEKYREDLSDMLVYTIDDEATMDIDDGVSFERVVATDGSVKEWVHIHVADPTRYIHANHRFAQFAQHRVTSLYPPERTYHMLPKQFSIEVASIKARRDGGLVPALTFSAVIRKDGTIEDFKFRPSYIRNIRRCTYNEVDDAIASASGNELHSEDVATFKHLCAIAQRHREDRIRTGAFHHDLPMFKVGLSKSGALPQFPQVPSTPQFLLPVASEAGLDRLPDIHISKVDLETPSQAMVSELMIVAGRVATRFAHAHNITLPFRTQESPACDNYEFGEIEIPTALPNLSPADARNAKAILRAVMEQVDPHTGLVKTAYYDEIRYMMNPAILSANPGPHFSVGINDQFGYARVTSPIRRYVDLLSHWQLKSALYKKIMFSRKTLESLIPKLL
ncbi:3'-5' RNA exonuclease complex component, partial [Spiromyces aspiralis]